VISLFWLPIGIIIGTLNGLTLRWTVERLRPGTALIGVPLVALGGLLRLGFATALLILASQYGIMPCLLSFAGLWLARWIIILFTLPHHQVSKELNG
jgi:hypothetical protein